ncbi:hypothetical protein ACLKA7_001776 [Drosophila subpalustris]
MIPVDILAMEMREIYLARAEMGNGVPVDAIRRAERQASLVTRQVRWDSATNGRWTHQLIPSSLPAMEASGSTCTSTGTRTARSVRLAPARARTEHMLLIHNADLFSSMLEGLSLQGSAEDMSTQAMAAVKQACDRLYGDKQVSGGKRRQHVYWWNTNIAEARKTCFKARQAYQRALGAE